MNWDREENPELSVPSTIRVANFTLLPEIKVFMSDDDIVFFLNTIHSKSLSAIPNRPSRRFN